MSNLIACVLAAGKGTRMKSDLPKVMHPIWGKPMLDYVLEALKPLQLNNSFILVGHAQEIIRAHLKDYPGLEFVLQSPQLGTGHAVQQVAPHLAAGQGELLILSGDMPLLTTEVLAALCAAHRQGGNALTVLTANLGYPNDFGRVIRDETRKLIKIVEHREASPEQKAVTEVNLGTYCVDIEALLRCLPRIGLPNVQQEIYLTDLVLVMAQEGLKVDSCLVEDEQLGLGINTRKDLARVAAILKDRILERLMLQGVTILDPATTYISNDAVIGADTVIYPGTMIEGNSVIGAGCEIGPYTRIVAAKIGSGTTVQNAVILEAEIGASNTIGPFAYVRPGTRTAAKVKIGDFVEIKNSFIDEQTKVPHLSYVGDATLGRRINIGAGTIFCNFDGVKKHPSWVEDDVYIGANTNLVAPVRIGKNSKTAAGSVVRHNVPANALVAGVPAQVKKIYKVPENQHEN